MISKIGSLVGNVEKVTKLFKTFGKALKGVGIVLGALTSGISLGIEIEHYKKSYNDIEVCRRKINQNNDTVETFVNDLKSKIQPICDSFILAFPDEDASKFSVNDIKGLINYVNNSIIYFKHLELNMVIIRTIMDILHIWTKTGWLTYEKLKSTIEAGDYKWNHDVDMMDCYLTTMCNEFFNKIYIILCSV